jgi:hypothetical protein
MKLECIEYKTRYEMCIYGYIFMLGYGYNNTD